MSRKIYEKFYENPGTKNDIISTLIKLDENSLNRNALIISQNMIAEFTRFVFGKPLPSFVLSDKSGRQLSISYFKGEFVYIQFFHAKSFASVQQMAFLKNYHDNKIPKLNVVTIFVGNNIEEMKSFLSSNTGYQWTFLFCSKKDELLKKYDIKVYPTYFLIDPEGNLAIEQTPSPVQNFEVVYNQQYKKWFD